MFEKYLSNFQAVLNKLVITDFQGKEISSETSLNEISAKLDEIKSKQKTIYLIGNGGSNGIVSHASVDFINTCKIKAVPLTDSSQITCFANDFGYEQVFSKPLEILLNSEDLLIAISSSGSSKNIINSVKVAKEKGAFIITLSGFKKENELRKYGNFNYWLDCSNYGIVEIGHALILHYISDKYSKLY